ncbi:hypothetical protein V8C37DRAFT_413853 [Trichoderma ceciliae]
MDKESIIHWIDDLEPASDPASLNVPEIASPTLPKPAAPNASRKRKAISSYSLASPPTSDTKGDDDNNMTSTPQKKRRFDPDATPRPGSRSIPSSAASISASETSSISKQSSAKGQIMDLRLGDTGIEYETLNRDTVPAVAKTLFNTMSNIEQGFDILPDALKQTIINDQELTVESFKRSQWRCAFRSDDEPDNLPGRIPAIAQIQIILALATQCKNGRHEEASWNALVHLPLLRLIFHNDLNQQCNDFSAVICTTARPHREFKPISSIAKMIDICIYATLDQNLELVTAIKAFSSTTPTKSINHTNFFTLQLNPIIISIETKQQGGGGAWVKAQLQLGVWLASHWALLYWGVRQKLLNQRMAQGLDAPTDDFKAETLEALSKLGFIPGIYIDGHRWHLVISTYNDGKTTFWSEWLFGDTKSLIKIYAIIAGVRELTAWGRYIYLPWFKENVLTLRES